jgi:hypothetical protein
MIKSFIFCVVGAYLRVRGWILSRLIRSSGAETNRVLLKVSLATADYRARNGAIGRLSMPIFGVHPKNALDYLKENFVEQVTAADMAQIHEKSKDPNPLPKRVGAKKSPVAGPRRESWARFKRSLAFNSSTDPAPFGEYPRQRGRENPEGARHEIRSLGYSSGGELIGTWLCPG